MSRRSLVRTRATLFPDHPPGEHELRITRARELMNVAGIAAVLFSRNISVYYICGTRYVHVGWDAPVSLTMSPQTTAIVTADADVYCQRFGPFDSDDVPIDTTLSESLEYYDSELELPNILSDYGIGSGARVGIEWGSGMCTGINPVRFLELKSRFENDLGVELVDASPVITSLMAIKSPLEIERMSVAVGAAARAMNRLYEHIELGLGAREVARLVSRLMIEEGADWLNHSQVMSEGDGTRKLMSCDPVDQPLEVGWVHLDLGCRFRRYTSDINRGLFLGRKPTQREEEVYAVRRGVNESLETLIKPGVSIDSVVQTVAEYIEGEGMEISIMGGQTFVGHSLGMELYVGPNLVTRGGQPPLIGLDDGNDVRFETGMMFTFECTVSPPGGESVPFFNIEDDVVVTEEGVRNMSAEVSRDLIVKV